MITAAHAWALATSGALFIVGPVLPLVIGRVERLVHGSPEGRVPQRELPSDPLIEVIVPAYLESSTIGPSVERLEIALTGAGLRHRVHVVASDVATALAAGGASTVTLGDRSGKPAAINLGMGQSRADVIVLTDANCEIEPPDWPRVMLAELAEADLVSANKTEGTPTEALFWRFESWVKSADSGRASTLAVVGEFLAFRRKDFRPVPPATMTDDLWLALNFHARGLRVVTSARIRTTEESVSPADQWERRVRIAEGVLTEAIPRVAELVQTAVGRHYLAHKVYRMTAGVAAFWVTAALLAGWRPPLTVPLVAVPLAAAIGRYQGVIEVTKPLDPVSSLIGMQAVPLAAAVRILRRHVGHSVGPAVGWRKVAR